MQAITTKYLGPTDSRGARIKATCDAGTLTIGYPHDRNMGEDAHRVAAEALRDKLGWTGPLIGGAIVHGASGFGYAFVFSPFEAIAEEMGEARRQFRHLLSRVGLEGISPTKGVASLEAVLDDLTRAVAHVVVAESGDPKVFDQFVRAADVAWLR